MKTKRQTENTRFVQSVGRALRRAAKAARKTAKMYGTPIDLPPIPWTPG